ncbi:Translation initiation factor IF-3 [Micractinium conductrix]|uniref:Translation initiation factor IF-3 n=1 Tax=Micractinium conductrix TaxID=554055 RepID=A0A2P6VHL7_9CHLO|nr:Translation initiation factor IF-3 [Micractinium conductrix]|eukprot:PSC73568.1 Translation initiation factor IF-3 [Micractinium conductrix]
MPTRPRERRSSRGGLPATLPWVVALMLLAAVGWLQLSRYEAKLHELREAADDVLGGTSDAGASTHERPASNHLRQLSSSKRCAVQLEAQGVLPDVQGRWAGREGGAEGRSRGLQHGSDGAAVAALLSSRRRLYDAMESSLLDKGLALGATVTQGLALGDLFTRDADGALQPVLEALAVPVRAVLLPLRDQSAAGQLLRAAERHLVPLVGPHGLWLQDSNFYHSTIYHASTHTDPMPASVSQVDAEERAIRHVGARCCPLRVVLERVVATPSGVVVACWQVVGGTDVFELRRRLSEALPHASRQQIVKDRAILHITLARIVAAPRVDGDASGDGSGGDADDSGRRGARLVGRRAQPGERRGDGGGASDEEQRAAAEEAAVLLQAAVDGMTAELCGLQATMDELWFAEEFHKLALALHGRFAQRPVPLQCGDGGGGGGGERAAAH